MKDKTRRFENIIEELMKSEEREYDYFHTAQSNIPQRKEIIAIISLNIYGFLLDFNSPSVIL